MSNFTWLFWDHLVETLHHRQGSCDGWLCASVCFRGISLFVPRDYDICNIVSNTSLLEMRACHQRPKHLIKRGFIDINICWGRRCWAYDYIWYISINGVLTALVRLVFHEDSESMVFSNWLCFHVACFRIVVYHVYFTHIYNDVLDTMLHIS